MVRQTLFGCRSDFPGKNCQENSENGQPEIQIADGHGGLQPKNRHKAGDQQDPDSPPRTENEPDEKSNCCEDQDGKDVHWWSGFLIEKKGYP